MMLTIGCIPKYNENKKRFVFSSALLLRITETGFVPVIILDPQSLLFCDGCILAGGDDIDPLRYHETKHYKTIIEDAEIEELEFQVVKVCQQLHLPLLGICRGMQVIAVSYGASLFQHIKDHQNTIHPLTNTCGFVEGISTVNSYHHQSIHILPSIFRCCAISTTHTIEAFEGDLIWGVQWHPELDEHDTILPFFFEKVLTNKINKNQN